MTDNAIDRLTRQRDSARNLAAMLEEELSQAQELVETLNRKLAVAEGKDIE